MVTSLEFEQDNFSDMWVYGLVRILKEDGILTQCQCDLTFY